MIGEILADEVCEAVYRVVANADIVRTRVGRHDVEHGAFHDLDEERILLVVELLPEDLLHTGKGFTVQVVRD
ncbi:MAG: hypothetical protein GVY29_02705 [Spirochaetes bacterium]|nr:hypothetical protein [Spirochaetota bacterium]